MTSVVSSGESISQVPLYSRYPAKGEVIGSLSIPALKQKFPVVEGTGDDDLKRGVGHFSQSVRERTALLADGWRELLD